MSIRYSAKANMLGHDIAVLEAEWGAARLGTTWLSSGKTPSIA